MGIPLEEHSPWCECKRPKCQRLDIVPANHEHPAFCIRHTISRIDPPPTLAIDSPVQSHPDSCTCQRPACQLRLMTSSSRRPSARPVSHTPSRMNPPPASSIDHPLRSHPVLSSATPPPTLSIPTGSRLEQQNPHVQSGNNNANAEGHLERMVGTHGNSSRPTDSAELDRIDNTIRLIRHLRSLRSRLQYNVDRPRTSIRASTTSSLLEHSNMPVSPVRRQQASQQMRDLSYSFGRFDEPLDEGGFHSQENSTNNHPRRRRQEVPQRPLAEQGQLLYDSLLRPHPPHPPRPSPELTSNFHVEKRVESLGYELINV